MRTALSTALVTILFTTAALAQSTLPPNEAEPIRGVVNVKFTPDALPDVKRQIHSSDLSAVASQSIDNKEPLREALPFDEGRKIFSSFMPTDTLATRQDTGEQVQLLDVSRWYTLTVPDTTHIESFVERIKEHPLVEAAAPEVHYKPGTLPSVDTEPNDPNFSDQWNLNNTTTGGDIGALGAWEFNKGRSDVTIAVVDGGIDYNHPDLDPGDRSRIIQGADVADGDGDPMDDIPSGEGFAGHGTLVAGIAGAKVDNSFGIAGVMWNTQIMPVKVAYTDGPWYNPFLGSGDAFPSVIADGIDYARQNDADIINLSLGRPKPPNAVERFFLGNPIGEAIQNAYRQGHVIVASSGNDSNDQVGFPAISSGVISVGNTTISDTRNSSSNYGPNLNVVAPGTNYPSTERGGGIASSVVGTSFAAPVVSGVAGLILSESHDRNLGLTNDDILHLMEQTADDLGSPGRNDEYGYGRVNAKNALEALQPPNDVIHASKTGGSSQKVLEEVWQTIYFNGLPTGIATGMYNVDLHEVTGHVEFQAPFEDEAPMVWIRDRDAKGWSAAAPNGGTTWFEITNVTQSGFNYKTYVYHVNFNTAGRTINSWHPASPSNVEVAYTAVGKPGTPPLEASISGPSYLDSGQQGTWTADVSGGSGDTSYDWEYQPTHASTWSDKACSGSSCSHTFHNHSDQVQNGGMRVTVTKGSESDQAATIVSVSPDCGDNVLLCPVATDKSLEASLAAEKALEASFMALRHFDAEDADEGARLTWSTEGMEPTKAFLVQHRSDTTAAWNDHEAVEASERLPADSTDAPVYQLATDELEPGAHQFRLQYAPEMASSQPSSAVDVTIELEDGYRFVTYPNPVRTEATVELAVAEAQDVTVAMYDVVGRRVATIHDGAVPAHQVERFQVAPSRSGLSSGQYFVRARGETFAETSQLTVVR